MKRFLFGVASLVLSVTAGAAESPFAACSAGDAVCVGEVLLQKMTPAVIKTCSCTLREGSFTAYDLKLNVFTPATNQLTQIPIADGIGSAGGCQSQLEEKAVCRP